MTQVTGTTAIIVDFICLLAALLLLVLRLYVRLRVLHVSIFNLQDTLVVFAWLCFLANVIQDVIDNTYGLWIPEIVLTAAGPPPIENFIHDPNHLRLVLQLSWVVAWLYYFVVYAVKAALLCSYLELFPPRWTRLRRALYFTILLCVVGFSASVSLNFFWCMPISSNWALTSTERCLSWSSVPPYFTSVLFHILTDLAVFILPFSLLRPLARSTSLSQLAGIAFMFSLGLVSIICVVVRTAMVGQACTFQFMACWGAAEQASAIMIACCLPLRYLRGSPPPDNRPRTKFRRYRIHDVEVAAPGKCSSRCKTPSGKSEPNPPGEEPDSCVRDWTAGSIGDVSTNRFSVIGGLGPRNPSMAHAELDFIMEYEEGASSGAEDSDKVVDGRKVPASKSKKGNKDLMITTFGGYDSPPKGGILDDSYKEADPEGRFKTRSLTSPLSPSRYGSQRRSQFGVDGPAPDADDSVNNRFSISSFGRKIYRH